MSPTFTHKKSKGSDGDRSFSVQRQPEINSSPEHEIPSYSRNAADSLIANVMRSMEEGEDSDEMSLEAGVQTKLTVGAVGDKYEQEADQVAAQVMSMSVAPDNSPPVQRLEEEDNPVQMWSLAQSITPVAQRRVDEQVQMRSLVQRAFQAGGNEASGDLESRLNASKGGGSALAPEVRTFMEPRFGADFSSVRVHTGGEAVQMNRELGAQAFTHGSDVYFGAGKEPGNNELTAHELTHVVQQTGSLGIQEQQNPDQRLSTKKIDSVETGSQSRNSSLISSLNDSKPNLIQRDGTELPPVVIRDEDLHTTIERDAAAVTTGVGNAYSFGSDWTTNPDGSLNTQNAIVRNAQSHDQQTAEDLQRLSEEMTMIRPLLMAWLRAGSAVNTIAQNDGINVNTPQAYRDALQRFGNEARDTTKPHTAEIRNLLMNNSATKLAAATSRLRSAMTRLQNAKRSLEMQRNSLQQAAVSQEVQRDQNKLNEVRRTIQTITTVITTTASLISAVSGVISAANASLSGAGVDAQTFGQITRINATGENGSAINPGIPGSSAAGQVASRGNIISSLLEATVFASRISEIQSRINEANSRIRGLQLRNVQLQTDNVVGDLQAATTDYEAAQHEAADIQQNLFQAYSLAGRNYDQHTQSGAAVPGAGNVHGASARLGEEHSMEAILALIAQLQIRGSARTSFGAALSNCQYMRRAVQIQDAAIAGSRSAIDPQTGTLVIPNIDVSIPDQGFYPSFDTQFSSQSLQQTVHLSMTAINFYDQNHPIQTQQETAWQTLLTSTTGGLAH